MPNIQEINPPELWAAGKNKTHIVKVGNMAFIGGQRSIDDNGDLIGKGDIHRQAQQSYAYLIAAVKAVGGTAANIVKTTTYLTHPDYVIATRPAREEAFGNRRPAGTIVVVSSLATPGAMIEVEGIAILDE